MRLPRSLPPLPSLTILFLLNLIVQINSIEPLTTAAVGGLAIAGGTYLYKNFIYSCQWSEEVAAGSFGLRFNLTNRLHGQPLVASRVYPAIIRHISTKSPSKPLVMSFHGPTGTGKNYASRIIADAITTRPSQFEVISCLNLCPCADACAPDHIMRCVQVLQDRISRSLRSCGRTIFVFDEIENLPPGIIDGIRHYLDYAPDSKETDHRYSIFIFLTNVGASSIMNIVYEAYLKGEHRQDIPFKKLEKSLTDAAFNEKSGFMKSKLILKDYIDLMIPFFPLEKDHVVKCITDYLMLCYGSRPSDKFLDLIMDEIRWVPPDGQIYSRSGCKKLESKVDIHVSPSLKKIC